MSARPNPYAYQIESLPCAIVAIRPSCPILDAAAFPVDLATSTGNAAAPQVRTWLVEPRPAWLTEEFGFDAEFWERHGIARADLLKRGIPAAEVYRGFLDACQGRHAIAADVTTLVMAGVLARALGAVPVAMLLPDQALQQFDTRGELDGVTIGEFLTCVGGPIRKDGRAVTAAEAVARVLQIIPGIC